MKKSLKNNKAITMVALVVTIIILIILAGISINLVLGKNGIITKAKQAKENTELAKIQEQEYLNELYSQIELAGESGDISYDTIVELTKFKKSIADYIEEAGGIKPAYSDEIAKFGESIKGIIKEKTKDATATKEDIREGKTAYVNGEILTGTAKDNNFSTSEWTDVPNAAINTSYHYQEPKLSIYGNICRYEFALGNSSLNQKIKVISDSKYFPKETTKNLGAGSQYGYCQAQLDTDGYLTIIYQSIESKGWASGVIFYAIN